MDVVPGQWWQRALAVVLVPAWIWAYLERDAIGVSSPVLFVLGMLAFMASVLAVPALYDKWMAFAVWLSVWATRVIFSVVYFVIVPFTWLFYVISGRARRGGHGDSLWIAKRQHDNSIDELERMG